MMNCLLITRFRQERLWQALCHTGLAATLWVFSINSLSLLPHFELVRQNSPLSLTPASEENIMICSSTLESPFSNYLGFISPRTIMSVNLQEADQASSSVETAQGKIAEETKALRLHLGLDEIPGLPNSTIASDHIPLFLIERAPYSPRGAKCKLPSCPDKIRPSDYRIALVPGMSGPGWVHGFSRHPGEPTDHRYFP
jgi:hypothetical protein